MIAAASARVDLRHTLRRPGDALASASIGIAPMPWAAAARETGGATVDPLEILDEIARTGFEGTQYRPGFPTGAVLRDALDRRGLRLAEVYVPLPATVDGPTSEAIDVAMHLLELLHEANGDMLCLALDGSPDRDRRAGRATESGTPVLTEPGWAALADVIGTIADRAAALGHPVSFHPHAGTLVETVAETERLLRSTDPARLGLCLDTGHWIVAGGDPVSALREHGTRVTHVHLKDVDPGVLDRLRAGELGSLGEAVRERLFTELGSGSLDLDGVIAALEGKGYAGWLIVEQDTSWNPPAESAAIGRRVLASVLRRHGTQDEAAARASNGAWR
jgi:inosose dehydratase